MLVKTPVAGIRGLLRTPLGVSRRFIDRVVESRAAPTSRYPECSDVALETLEPAIVPFVREALTELHLYEDVQTGLMDRPQWDIVLMVFVDQFEGKTITVERLMRSCHSSRTATLRLVEGLVDEGVLLRDDRKAEKSGKGIRLARPIRRAVVEYFLQHADEIAVPRGRLSFSRPAA